MSQDIGPVTQSHSMSLVVTLTKDLQLQLPCCFHVRLSHARLTVCVCASTRVSFFSFWGVCTTTYIFDTKGLELSRPVTLLLILILKDTSQLAAHSRGVLCGRFSLSAF
jgi:hypothetical protein